MANDTTQVFTVNDLMSGSHQSAYLIMISAKTAATIGKMFKLEAETILGRSSEVGIQVEDDGISRKHAKVVRLATGQYQVVDLDSTNGTFLNGTRVNLAALNDGDKIQIGTNTVLKFSLQDQLEEQYHRAIYESATRDGLTKVYNKKYFLETLSKEFAFCLRHRMELSLIMLDVDHFKKINDSHGHPGGDFVLIKLAQRINETLRAEDLFARYGGEEFSILLRDAGPERAQICAERCRKAIETTKFEFEGKTIPVTISLGTSSLLDSGFTQAEEMISKADQFLYTAKKNGRNRAESKVTVQENQNPE